MPTPMPPVGGMPCSSACDVVLVVGLGLLVARGLVGALLLEAGALLVRVVQLGEGVRELHAGGEASKRSTRPGLGAVVLRERRELLRVVHDEGRVLEVRLHVLRQQVVHALGPGALARGELVSSRDETSTPVFSWIASRSVTRRHGGEKSIGPS